MTKGSIHRKRLVTRQDISAGAEVFRKNYAEIRSGNKAIGCPITVDFTENGIYSSLYIRQAVLRVYGDIRYRQ